MCIDSINASRKLFSIFYVCLFTYAIEKKKKKNVNVQSKIKLLLCK